MTGKAFWKSDGFRGLVAAIAVFLRSATDLVGNLERCRITNEPPVDATTANPALPVCLVAVIRRALVKDPARRRTNGEEMAWATREFAAACGFAGVSL
jgi:hypothetical protein